MDFLLFYKITYLATAAASIIISFIVLKRNFKEKFNLLYALLNISVVIWAFGRYLVLIVQSQEFAIFWTHFLYIGSILIYPLYLHTILTISGVARKRKYVLLFAYLNGVILTAINLFDFIFGSNFFIADVVPKLFFPFYEVPGKIYILQFFANIIIPIYTVGELTFAYLKAKGLKKGQLRYILYSSLLAMAGGGTILLLVYDVPVQPFGIPFVVLHFITMTYAITQYRLMNIKLIIFRTLAFASIIGIITAVYAFIAYVLGILFENYLGFKSDIFTGIIVAIVVALGYAPIRNLIEKITNSFLHKLSYNPQELISKVTKISTSIIDPQSLLHSMAEAFEGAFHQDKIAFILYDKDKKLFPIFQEGFERKVLTEFLREKQNVLPKYFDETRDIFVIEELKTAFDNGEYIPKDESVLLKLYEQDVAIVIPLYANKKPVGFLVLGNKKNGELYTKQDIDTLAIISDQSAVGIANAQLYEEQRQFGIKLEQTVKERTAELQVANKKLTELDKAKSEFISIASHQLRTPLTVIKGYISMILEGSFGKTSKVISDNLNKVYTSNERLIELVENLLDISRIESGRQEFNFTTLDMKHEAQVVYEELEQKAKTKGLEFKLEAPKEKLEIVGDSEKLHEVIMNFTDNAVKYTKEGFVHITLRKDGDNIIYEVKDSGIGMNAEDKKALFKKFSRAAGTSLVHTEGTGLGLYVAKMIIDTHKGEVGADSKGRGKGSTFWFSIPVKGKGGKVGRFKVERKEGSMAAKDTPA